VSRTPPARIAPETFIIQDHVTVNGDGGVVHLNAMLIRAAEPVVVDTGAPIHRDRFLDDLFGLIEPADVRWLFLSHDDVDHAGNLEPLVDACPNAVVVTTWMAAQRLAIGGARLPADRWRLLDDGDVLDAGDRALVVQRPLLYDAPATRGLFDTTTGVLWAADCFGALLPDPVVDAVDADDVTWRTGFMDFHQGMSPWCAAVEVGWWRRAVARFASRIPDVIASSHGPVVRDHCLTAAIDMLGELPAAPFAGQPPRPGLDQTVGSVPIEIV
jgi:flavorubredoxin